MIMAMSVFILIDSINGEKYIMKNKLKPRRLIVGAARYDSFFSEDTIFELDGRQVKYIDAKESMEKLQAFTSKDSYGNLEEWDDFKEWLMITCFRNEYTVEFFLPVDYQDGENTAHVFIEGEMILRRKGMFFFDIEKVTFYDDNIGFLEEFLGWGIR